MKNKQNIRQQKKKIGLTNKGFVVMNAQKPLLKNFQLGKCCWGERSLKSLLILTTEKVSSTDHALDIRHFKILRKILGLNTIYLSKIQPLKKPPEKES